MNNLHMKEALDKGEAIDVSVNPVDPSGYYILPSFREGADYCDAKQERWVWSIGRRLSDGVILASVGPDFYDKEGYECLWLR